MCKSSTKAMNAEAADYDCANLCKNIEKDNGCDFTVLTVSNQQPKDFKAPQKWSVFYRIASVTSERCRTLQGPLPTTIQTAPSTFSKVRKNNRYARYYVMKILS